MITENELTLENALAQADQDAERINLDMVNHILAEIAAEEHAIDG